jgi:hypothetical protein
MISHLYRGGKQFYKTWRIVCDKCHDPFTVTCWETELPTDCRCGGKFVSEQMRLESVAAPQPAPIPAIVRATSEAAILRDIEQEACDFLETRWSEHLGG